MRKIRYNLRSRQIKYEIGENVFLRNFKQSDAASYYMAKLAPKYIPVQIVDRIGTNSYKVQNIDGKIIPGTFNTEDLKR